jgi:hypothetical protein
MRLLGERRIALDMTLEEYELNRDVRAAIERGDTPDTPSGRLSSPAGATRSSASPAATCKPHDALLLVLESASWKNRIPRAAPIPRPRTQVRLKEKAGRCAPGPPA